MKALLIGLVLALLAAEGGLRLLLFCDLPLLGGFARGLREPEHYADRRREDLFWKLMRIWTPPEELQPFGPISPAVGWTGERIDPVTLVMEHEQRVHQRRPVLLYGDSFAECVTPLEHTWQGLLERSPEGRTHAMVNFGTSGFGTDQSLLLLEATIERFAARNPLVIFSIFLDEDPDRTVLNFRGLPKPRFDLVAGELVLRPLEESDAQTWWDNHPPGVASYAWRLLRGRAGPLPVAWQRRLDPVATDAHVIELNRALIARMHGRLASLGIEHFVLGFHGRMMLEGHPWNQWREEFVREICGELGVPFLSSHPYLMAAVDGRSELANKHLIIDEGPIEGHYNERANRAVFEAIRQAIHGNFAREDVSGVRVEQDR